MENTIRRAIVLAEGATIEVRDLRGLGPQDAPAPVAAEPAPDPLLTEDGHIRTLGAIETEAIGRALEIYGGRMSETARRLGIGRSTLYRKIEELQIRSGAG